VVTVVAVNEPLELGLGREETVLSEDSLELITGDESISI
jgi:hypothetical protein